MSFPEKIFRRSDELPDDEVLYIDALSMGFTSVHGVQSTNEEIVRTLETLQEQYDQSPSSFKLMMKVLRANLLHQDRKLCAIQDNQHDGYIVNNDTQMNFNTDVIVLHCSEVVSGAEDYIHLVPEGVIAPPTMH